MSHEKQVALAARILSLAQQEGGRIVKGKYRAFEIQDDKVKETLVEGNLPAIADCIRGCQKDSIILIQNMEGEPFLVGLSKMFLYCEDNDFLNTQLLPYLHGM